MKGLKIAVLLLLVSGFAGCFSAKKYRGPSRVEINRRTIVYRFKSPDYKRSRMESLSAYYFHVDSLSEALLTDDRIRRFFDLNDGRITPRYDRIYEWRNEWNDDDFRTYAEFRQMMDELDKDDHYNSFQVQHTDNSLIVLRDGADEMRISYDTLFFIPYRMCRVSYDDAGNVKSMKYDVAYRHELLFEGGSGYYIYADFRHSVTPDTLRAGDERFKRSILWKDYDDAGFFSVLWAKPLDDSTKIVISSQGYAIAEGRIENNCKAGEWTYRDERGEIERTERYDPADGVDVRFPHSYFNKRKFRNR